MVVYYQIAGRKVGSHVLSMATLGTIAGGVLLTRGGKEPHTAAGPPIKAESKDQEDFIQEFLKNVDGGDGNKKEGAKH